MLDASNRTDQRLVSDLAQTMLPDHDGTEVILGDLWRDGPAALVWLRHYG